MLMHISYLSPGSVPLPPAPCTSVEIYVSHLARTVSHHHSVTLYAKGKTQRIRQKGNLTIRTFVSKGGLPYLRRTLHDIGQRHPDLIQVENRIAYIPHVKKAFPHIPVVLNLHSNVLIQQQPEQTVNACFRAMDALVVNSNYLKKFLLAKYPQLPAEKVQVIHLGIHPQKFPSRFTAEGSQLRQETRRRLRVPSKQKVLLFVGRFIPRKGIEQLLDAFREVCAAHADCELWVIGGRPYKTDNAFHQTVKKKAAGLPVRFLGYVKQPDLPAYYAAADLFVCPSQRPESFGMVNLEAAAAGLPVIASADWGIKEAVKEGVSGLLVDTYKDPSAFAAKIDKLLADPERLTQLGQSGREWVSNRFSWQTTAEHFQALYRQLLR